MPPVTYYIRPFQPHDQEQVLSIWGQRFGEISQPLREDLRAQIDGGDDAVNRKAYVVDTEDGVHGFVVGSVWENAESLAEALEFALEPDELPPVAGLVTEIAMSVDAEGTGVASELLTELHKWFAHSPVNSGAFDSKIYTASWRRPDHDSFDLFSSADYTTVTTVPEFFDNRTSCPECGGSCSCPATIMQYDLQETPGNRIGVDGPVKLRATKAYGARRVPDV